MAGFVARRDFLDDVNCQLQLRRPATASGDAGKESKPEYRLQSLMRGRYGLSSLHSLDVSFAKVEYIVRACIDDELEGRIGRKRIGRMPRPDTYEVRMMDGKLQTCKTKPGLPILNFLIKIKIYQALEIKDFDEDGDEYRDIVRTHDSFHGRAQKDCPCQRLWNQLQAVSSTTVSNIYNAIWKRSAKDVPCENVHYLCGKASNRLSSPETHSRHQLWRTTCDTG